jgi:hypothetical protein
MSRDYSVTPYKRGPTGSNPVAPTRYAQCAEACRQVLDPVWRCPVIRQREAGFAAPQHVAEDMAQVPGHYLGRRQLPSGDLLVSPALLPGCQSR